jgi:opine dehydrogenase
MNIGIHSVSSQSGGAYLVDMIKQGHVVYGYARTSHHGVEFVDTVNQQGGIYLIRPDHNRNDEASKFIPLGDGQIGHDLRSLIDHSDILIITHPSHYFVKTIQELKEAGITEKRIPIVLSPSRTFAVPYLWEILGAGYPFVSFATCPYSCKTPHSGTVFIKRRKRNWVASLEGHFNHEHIDLLESLFPQAIFNNIPATTSIGNIGAVLHPAPYLLNYEAVKQAEFYEKVYNFYMDGIAANPEVAKALEDVDQVRLKIADTLGLQVFGLREDPRDNVWKVLIDKLRREEARHANDVEDLRHIRHDHLVVISHAITSVQHWLDYTYGVRKIKGESLQKAIARTPTYQKNSIPQSRYVEEDIPTGIVPLLAIAERLDIDGAPLQRVLDLYHTHYKHGTGHDWRDLEHFSTDFIVDYLTGKLSVINRRLPLQSGFSSAPEVVYRVVNS